jgi:hypothetical protein
MEEIERSLSILDRAGPLELSANDFQMKLALFFTPESPGPLSDKRSADQGMTAGSGSLFGGNELEIE